MKFICDVHISYKIQKFLRAQGHQTIHVNELPNKSETHDDEICRFADVEDCILITKDADFTDSYYLRKTPKKIIKINLGNIATTELIEIFSDVLPVLHNVMERKTFLIEVDKNGSYSVDQND